MICLAFDHVIQNFIQNQTCCYKAYTNFLFIGKLKDQSQRKDSSHKNKKCLDQINLLSSL